MNKRRKLLATVALVALVASSGCIGFLVGDEPATFEASQATVSDAALSNTDYTEAGVEEQTINETVEASGQERTVQATNWIAQYHRSIDLGATEQEAAVFVVFSTPQVNVLGKSLNPVGTLDNEELLEQVQSQYDGFDDVEKVGERNTTMLGEETEVSKFATTTRMNGMEIDVYVHLTTVEHGDDHVIALSIYPQRLDGEEERAFTLIQSIEHAE